MVHRSSEKQAAYEMIRGMECPPSISRTRWAALKRLLYVIARNQPNCFYGQVRLGEMADMSERSVRIYTRLAESLGVLMVIPDAGMKKPTSPSRTNWYLIPELPVIPAESAACIPAESAADTTGLLRNPAITEEEPSEEPSVPLKVLRRAAGPPTREDTMPRLPGETDAELRQRVAADASAAGRVKKRPPARDPDPSRRLERYFVEAWERNVVDRGVYADVRVLDAKHEIRGYIRSEFFAPAVGRSRTEDEVKKLIDDFGPAVCVGDARLKPGQSAWGCFTGWWGREASISEVADSYSGDASRRYAEKHRRGS